NRVSLPRHRTETGILRGEGESQLRLDLPRLLVPHEVFLAHEDDRFLVAEREFYARKCGEGCAGLAVTKTFEHLALRRHGRAAELHAAVHEALRADEFVVQMQAEVFVARARGQEFIARILLERTSDNHALADAPDGIRLALPAGERLAVEQSRGGGEGGGQAQKQQR